MLQSSHNPALETRRRERRRTPRVQALGHLHGHIVTINVPMSIREIGLGGFSLESSLSFPVDAVHDFKLSPPNGDPILLRGRVAYCRLQSAEGDLATYITGFSLLHGAAAESAESFATIVDEMTAQLSFDE